MMGGVHYVPTALLRLALGWWLKGDGAARLVTWSSRWISALGIAVGGIGVVLVYVAVANKAGLFDLEELFSLFDLGLEIMSFSVDDGLVEIEVVNFLLDVLETL